MRRPVKFGKYLLLDRISIGGMAEVFKAKSFGLEGFEKIVAIKRILPSLGQDQDFIDMFIDEAKISGQLAHANIGQIHELGRVDDAHFIAMEFIWGRDLLQIQNRFRKRKKRLSARTSCYIVMKVCEGLNYAHKKRDIMGQDMQIVHRDCSPQNVVVSFEGEVKLIDFGIAKAAQRSAHTTAGVLKGKFAYMSPEQVRGLPLDRRTDIFSLGIILYESLTGKRLFNGENDFTTLEKVRNAIVERKDLEDAKVPDEVQRIVRKALARNAESRYQWCSEMRDDLNAFMQNSDEVFSNRTLGLEMSEAFSVELGRERELMDLYSRIDENGVMNDSEGGDDYSEVLVESMGAGTPTPPPSPDPVDHGDFTDSPTEIFGELALMDVVGDVEEIESSQPLVAHGVSAKIEVIDSEVSTVEIDVPDSLPSGQKFPSVATDGGVQPFGSFTPAIPTAVKVAPGSSSKITMSFPEVSTTESVPNPGVPLVSNVGEAKNRNILLGIGFAVAAILLALGAKTFLLGSGSEAVASAPQATLVLLVSDKESAEVYIDNTQLGFVPSGDESLTLESLTPGAHTILIKRNGESLCEEKIVLTETKIRVFNCDASGSAIGLLTLDGLLEGDTLVLDGSPVTAETLEAPLKLRANKLHQLALSRPGSGILEFKVTVSKGEDAHRAVTWATENQVADAGVEEEFMDMKPDRVAPGGEHEKYVIRLQEKEKNTRSVESPTEKSDEEDDSREDGKVGLDEKTNPKGDDASVGELADGYLTVWSEPWARIYIDGKDTGKITPVVRSTKFTLSAGSHRVTLRVGSIEHKFKVNIVPGKYVKLAKFLTEK